MLRSGRPAYGLRARGLSIVELMVGMAIGLFVVAGASFIAVNQIGDNRRLSLETQVQQDLRAVADLMARELRRAGHWGASESGVWYAGGPNAAPNPYSATVPAAAGPAVQEVTFRYSRDAVEDGVADPNTERFGFKLDADHTIKVLVGGAWQALTDPNVLKVTRFDVTLDKKTVLLSCFKECPGGGTACWPRQDVRRFTIEIAGEAVFDASVKRSVSDSVRLRNDATTGACPA